MRLKKKNLLLVLVIILSLVFSACSKSTDNTKVTDNNKAADNAEPAITKNYKTLLVDDYNKLDIDNINEYDIDIVFNPEDKTYTGKQTVRFVNNEDVELDRVYFHLYPNAFRSKETTPVLFDSSNPNGFKPGYIDITKLTLDDDKVNNANFVVDKTILKIPLKEALKPGENIDIYMEYTVVIPPAQDRFGYGDKTFNFGNWYPVVAVFDETGWNLDKYYSVGDPFYSDTSNYNVTIEAPKEYIIASSGNILSQKEKNDNITWEIEAKLMRDFAWVSSKDFIIHQKDVDGTLVKTYFLEENEEVMNYANEAAYNSIKTFNSVFGKYPYGQYSVVATSFPSGMEYPGIVFIGESIYNNNTSDLDWLRIVIVHETGHQWWYSVVGNDEIDEAWLDESLTTYSEVVYFDEVFSESAGNNYYNTRIKTSYERRAEEVRLLSGNERILKPLKDFKNWIDYGALVYSKGAMFVHEIESKYGEEVLYNILKEYFNEYRFLNATTEDFIKICENVTGDDFSAMVNEWLYDK